MATNLSGSLAEFSLAEVLSLLGMGGRTARMQVTTPTTVGAVHLVDGQVSSASADLAHAGLLRAVVAALPVPADDLAVAIGSGEPVRTLVDTGVLDRARVQQVAGQQCTEAIGEMLDWSTGEFAVWVGELDPGDVGLRADVEPLVDAARARARDWQELRAALPTGDSVLALVSEVAHAPVIESEDWAVLARVDGHRTLEEVLAALGASPLAAGSRLVELMSRGLVAVGAAAGAAERERTSILLDSFEGADHGWQVPPEPTVEAPSGPAPDVATGVAPAAAVLEPAADPMYQHVHAELDPIEQVVFAESDQAVEQVGFVASAEVAGQVGFTESDQAVEQVGFVASAEMAGQVGLAESDQAVEQVGFAQSDQAVEQVGVVEQAAFVDPSVHLVGPGEMPTAPPPGLAVDAVVDQAPAAFGTGETPGASAVTAAGPDPQVPVGVAWEEPVPPPEPLGDPPGPQPDLAEPGMSLDEAGAQFAWSPWAREMGLGEGPVGTAVPFPPVEGTIEAADLGAGDTEAMPVPQAPMQVPQPWQDAPVPSGRPDSAVVPEPRQPEAGPAPTPPAGIPGQEGTGAHGYLAPAQPGTSEAVPVADPVADPAAQESPTAEDPLAGGLLAQLMSSVRGL